MENKHQNNHGFGNGFVLGLLVGVIVTLLVTTKKGRELFREFTEKGLDKFSAIEKKLQETEEVYDEVDDESDYIPPEEKKEVRQLAQETKSLEVKEERHESRNGSAKPSHIRRFFRAKKS